MNSHFINGRWIEGAGETLTSLDPATKETVWSGRQATPDEVNDAITAARSAFQKWALTPLSERIATLERYRDLIRADGERLARSISHENGKPFWEAKTEAAAVAGKVDLSIKAQADRAGTRETATGATSGVLRHRPHGVMAVLAPFNFPAHLANGHIVPALLAGNSVVVKPSELTPGPLAIVIEKLAEAGVPEGVINLVQGARETGEAITAHPDIDGLLFTGGSRTGMILHQHFATMPEKILALELGGNNPLIWWDTEDIESAAYGVVQSAFLTAGQRCTCARRLIVPTGARGDAALKALSEMTQRVMVGAAFSDPQPFMGPLIHDRAAKGLATAFADRLAAGGKAIVPIEHEGEGSAFIRPGIIDMTDSASFPDEEHFGPMLQVYRVGDFETAIERANDTRFGLAAGLFSDQRSNYEMFSALSRAGIVNWNRQTTGASGAAPFGGIGHSGNHRPSAFYAADYCAYPVASMEGETLLAKPEDAVGLRA